MKLHEHQYMKRLERDTRSLCPGIVWFRHTEALLLGVPDVEVAYFSRTTWLEIKWLELPKRADTPIYISKLMRPGQLRFLLDRVLVGVTAFIVVGSELGTLVFRPTEAQELRTASELAGKVWPYSEGKQIDLRPLLDKHDSRIPYFV